MELACCGEPLNLGCFDSCNEIELSMNANKTGVFTVLYHSNGGSITKHETDVIISGQPLTFDNIFREIGVSVFQILDPDLDQFEFTFDGVLYDKFMIQNFAIKP